MLRNMICTPQFIQVYNETFKFIDENLGSKAVEKYWLRIADIILGDLKEAVEKDGLKGCVDYWTKTLTAEKAGFQILHDGDVFVLEILRCPSLAILKEPYKNYCKHCKVMYKKIFNDLGYKYEIESGGGQCKITISK